MNDAGNGITEQAAAHEEEKKKKQLSRVREIERTIVKTYRKDIWGRFVKAVERYELIKDGDCIAVCEIGRAHV